jgi:hypothetical protein
VSFEFLGPPAILADQKILSILAEKDDVRSPASVDLALARWATDTACFTCRATW